MLQERTDCCGTGTEIQITQDPLNYGIAGKVWEAGSVFAQYLVFLLSNQQLSSMHILELGSGTGLAGITVAKYLEKTQISWSMTLTDTFAVLPLLQKNISLNFPNDSRINCRDLLWGSNLEEMGLDFSRLNIVFGTDVVYDETCFDDLKQTLEDLVNSNENVWIFLAYVRRRRAEKRFWNMIKKIFLVKTVINDPNRDLYGSKLNIVRLVKKNQSYCSSISPSAGASKSS